MKSQTKPKTNGVRKLQDELKYLREQALRARADYINLEKRNLKEREEHIAFSNANLLLSLLPILDTLEEAQKTSQDEGLKLACAQFKKVLSEEGLEEIGVLGKIFDPLFCEAAEVTRGEENRVLEVIRKGYFYKGKILRPAQVKVGKENPSGGNLQSEVERGDYP